MRNPVPSLFAARFPWLAGLADVEGLGLLVDHTLLRPEATPGDIARLCDEALRFQFGAVCVNGAWIRECVLRLDGAPVKVASVIGFPLGAASTAAKAAEAELAVGDGASELDMVIALGQAQAGHWTSVEEDLGRVVEAAGGTPVKAILESALLSPSQLEQACRVALQSGARFVKTSTGFHPAGGATVAAVAAMRRVVGIAMGVKASGGIRRPEDALQMLAAGADRIGSSAAAGWTGFVGPGSPPLGELLARTGAISV
ncbi:MAG TPA: deoxyribose-phosphate aldolase [Gemmatimonadales bacterium]|nr:deoxyribose-phosphate aldolase [Gemmatimonadales bacterium]